MDGQSDGLGVLEVIDSFVIHARDLELVDAIMQRMKNASGEEDFQTGMTMLIVNYRRDIKGD